MVLFSHHSFSFSWTVLFVFRRDVWTRQHPVHIIIRTQVMLSLISQCILPTTSYLWMACFEQSVFYTIHGVPCSMNPPCFSHCTWMFTAWDTVALVSPDTIPCVLAVVIIIIFVVVVTTFSMAGSSKSELQVQQNTDSPKSTVKHRQPNWHRERHRRTDRHAGAKSHTYTQAPLHTYTHRA